MRARKPFFAVDWVELLSVMRSPELSWTPHSLSPVREPRNSADAIVLPRLLRRSATRRLLVPW